MLPFEVRRRDSHGLTRWQHGQCWSGQSANGHRLMFDWDDHNAGHLWDRHGVRPHEAEDVLFDHEQLPRHPAIVNNEIRVEVIGHTREGRILKVVITSRAGLIRVLSAYPVNGRQLRDYRRGLR